MPVKSAKEKLQDLRTFIPNAKKAIGQFEQLAKRLEEPEFQKLWDSDSAAALRAVGIDPEARQEMGLPAYEDGAQCNNCLTPLGHACHC
jgi:hypothetical protein